MVTGPQLCWVEGEKELNMHTGPQWRKRELNMVTGPQLCWVEGEKERVQCILVHSCAGWRGREFKLSKLT